MNNEHLKYDQNFFFTLTLRVLFSPKDISNGKA